MKLPYKVSDSECGFIEVNLGDTIPVEGILDENGGEVLGIVVNFFRKDPNFTIPNTVLLYVSDGNGNGHLAPFDAHTIAKSLYELHSRHQEQGSEYVDPIIRM